MPTERNLMLEKYGISENRYKELKYFCRQYTEKIEALKELSIYPSVHYGEISGSKGTPSKPTEKTAIKLMRYNQDIETINACLDFAAEGEKWMKTALTDCIIKGVKFFDLVLYCHPTVFYKARHKFFVKLNDMLLS